MKEEWRSVPGFEGFYEVSTRGRVRTGVGRVLRTPTGKRGYPNLNLHKPGFHKLACVHRLVALAFLPNPENKPTVNHIDGNKENNVIENLEWATQRENIIHARANGLHLTDGDKPVVQILNGEVLARYSSASAASRITGFNRGNICSICRGNTRLKTTAGYTWRFV